MKQSKLAISADGEVTMIYSDETAELLEELGEATVERVSNVEPVAGGWQATMIDGAVLPVYRLRADALAAEVEYLNSKLF